LCSIRVGKPTSPPSLCDLASAGERATNRKNVLLRPARGRAVALEGDFGALARPYGALCGHLPLACCALVLAPWRALEGKRKAPSGCGGRLVVEGTLLVITEL